MAKRDLKDELINVASSFDDPDYLDAFRNIGLIFGPAIALAGLIAKILSKGGKQ